MGIFDFVKEAGEKLRGGGEEETAAAAPEGPSDADIENQLLKLAFGMQLPVEGLNVDFADGVATVSGEAESQAIRENMVLALGNIQGVARVDDRMTVKEAGPEAQMYTVKSGDTLSKIAREFYGDGSKYPVIFEANTPMLENPDLIYPGQVLRIPPQ
jgi:nucleoid-associated protein YgaU